MTRAPGDSRGLSSLKGAVCRDDRVGFTISAGVASWPDNVRDLEDLLPCADERLYAAKRAGRNRVTGPPFAAATAAIQARSA